MRRRRERLRSITQECALDERPTASGTFVSIARTLRRRGHADRRGFICSYVSPVCGCRPYRTYLDRADAVEVGPRVDVGGRTVLVWATCRTRSEHRAAARERELRGLVAWALDFEIPSDDLREERSGVALTRKMLSASGRDGLRRPHCFRPSPVHLRRDCTLLERARRWRAVLWPEIFAAQDLHQRYNCCRLARRVDTDTMCALSNRAHHRDSRSNRARKLLVGRDLGIDELDRRPACRMLGDAPPRARAHPAGTDEAAKYVAVRRSTPTSASRWRARAHERSVAELNRSADPKE